MRERPHFSRTTTVPTVSALSAFSKENSGSGLTQAIENQLHTGPIFASMACCALPSYDLQTNQIEIGISCSGCQLALQNGISIEAGDWDWYVCDKVYSRKGYLEHFAWCEQAQALWLESNNGTIEPSRLPERCKNGGYLRPCERSVACITRSPL